MSLNVAAGISAVLGVPLAAVPIGLSIHSTVKSLSLSDKLKKWNIRVEQIAAVVASKGEFLTAEELKKFLIILEL